MLRPLIIPGAAPLGDDLNDIFQRRGRDCHCIPPSQLEATAGFGEACVVIDIHTAAALRNGACQSFSQRDFDQMVDLCMKRNWPLLLLSDSSVFAGGTAQRYREDDPPTAINGQINSLASCEMRIRASVASHIILRTGPIISHRGSNPLTDVLRCMRAGEPVAAAGGSRFCPTTAGDVARVFGAIVDQLDCGAEPWGTYHYQSSDPIDGFEFGEVVLAAAGQYWDIESPTKPRQEKSGFSVNASPLLQCQRIRDTFGIQQLSWRKALPALIKQIHDEETA